MTFDLLFFGGVGVGVLAIGTLVYWLVEDFGGRDVAEMQAKFREDIRKFQRSQEKVTLKEVK